MRLIFNSSSSIVIRTLLFFIYFLFKIIFLKINFIYIVIRYCLFEILNWSFIHFLKMTLSFVIVFTSISYLTEMIFNLFSWVHVLNIIVILVLESISLSFVVILSFSSCIMTERIIRISNSDFFSFLELLRFSTHRKLQEWSSFI